MKQNFHWCKIWLRWRWWLVEASAMPMRGWQMRKVGWYVGLDRGEGSGGGVRGCPPGSPQIYSSHLGAAAGARADAKRNPGERLALTVQQRRVIAVAPSSSTGSSSAPIAPIMINIIYHRPTLRYPHRHWRKSDFYAHKMCRLIEYDFGSVADPMS